MPAATATSDPGLKPNAYSLQPVLADPRWESLTRVQRANARTRLFTSWLEANPERKDAFLNAPEEQRNRLLGGFVERLQAKYPEKFSTPVATGKRLLRADPGAVAVLDEPDGGDREATPVEETVPVPIMDPASEQKLAAVGEAARTRKGSGFEGWSAEDFSRLGPLVDVLHPEAAAAARSAGKPVLQARAKELGFPESTTGKTIGRQVFEGVASPVVQFERAATRRELASPDEATRTAAQQRQALTDVQAGLDWALGAEGGFEAAGAVGALVGTGSAAAAGLGKRLLTKAGIGTLAAVDAGLGAAYAASAPGYLAAKVDQWAGEENATRKAILTALEAGGISALAGVGVRQWTLRRMKEFARTQGFTGASNADLRAWYVDQMAARAKPAGGADAAGRGQTSEIRRQIEAPVSSEADFLRRAEGEEISPATTPSGAGAAVRTVDSGPPEGAPPAPGTMEQGSSNETPAAESVETTTIIDPAQIPTLEVPLGRLKLSKDVEQFKESADEATGVVQALTGSYQRLGTAPIVAWQRINGDLEVITGRHRLDLARRSGEKTIPTQIVREADGFTAADALTFDAQSNIRDGQGEIRDYAHYFRHAPIDRAAAEAGGLLSRAKGQRGWIIGKDATDGLYSLYRNEAIPEEKAVAIARGAPGNDPAQSSAIRAAKGKSAAELELYARNLSQLTTTAGDGEQLGFAGIDASFADFEREAAAIAKVQAEAITQNTEQIRAAKNAAKNPEAARAMGVDVNDPAAVAAKIAELEASNAQLRAPDPVAWEQLRRQAGLPPREMAELDGPPADAPLTNAVDPRTGQRELLPTSEGFSLFSEAAPDNEALLRAEIARREADQAQTQMFPTEEVRMTRQEAEDRARGGGRSGARGEAGPRRSAAPPRAAEPVTPGGTTPPPPKGVGWPVVFDPNDPNAVFATWGPGVPVRYGGLAGIKAVELPELVRIARELMGRAPLVRKLPKNLGNFMPAGRGQIKLRPDLFRNPIDAALVLGHELFHLADYLPDRTMARGNLLGRLGTLRDYLRTTLDLKPTDPSKVLTPKDRAEVRNKAYQKTKQQLGGRPLKEESEVDYHKWGEEWSRNYHEMIEEEIDRRGLAKNQIVREELLGLTEWWKPYLDDLASGAAPDSYRSYRESSEELYADFGSVLFLAPGELKARAPVAWSMFWNYLDRKPEVKQALFEVQELLAGPVDAKLAKRRAEMRAGFERGDEVYLRKVAEREAEGRTFRGFWGALQRELVDTFAPITRPARKLAAKGNVRAQATEWLLDEHPLAMEGSNYLLMQQVYERAVQPLLAAGATTADLGEVLLLNRVANERILETDEAGQVTGESGRAVLANPGGQTPETAREQLAYLERVHGPQKWAAIQGAVREFHDVAWQVVNDAVDAGTYSRETFEKVIAPNRGNYATFAVVDYLQDFIPAGIRQQRGTLNEVANPFLASMLKLTSLNKLNQLQRAKRGVVQFMQEFFPGDIKPAQTRFDGKRNVPVPNPEHGGGTFELLEDGKVAGYYVKDDVAEMFDAITPARASAVIRALNWAFRTVFYPMFITYNPVFQLAMGPIRDLRRGFRNTPRGAGMRQIGEYLANLGTLTVEGLNAAAAGTGLRRLGVPGIPVPMTASARSVRNLLRGQGDVTIREMIQHSAVGSPIDTFSTGPNGERALQKLLERFRLLPDQNREEFWRKWFLRPVYELLRGIEFAGLSMEYLPKVGTWRHLVKSGAGTPEEVAAFVRNHVGVPNFRRTGKHTRIAGTIFPFFNVMVQGLRDDLRLAGGRKSAAGWWLRWAAGSGLARILQALGAAGLLGAGIKEYYDYISSYDQTNYTAIPLGWADGGDFGKRAVYARIPEDETDRLLGGLIHIAITGLAGERKGSAAELGAFAGGQLPSLNPVLELAGGWGQWLAGRNPIDTFRGNPVLSDAEFKAGGWDSFQGMASWTYEQTGLQNFVRWDPRAQNWAETTLSATPGINRMLKISDYGARERQSAKEAEADKLRARVRLHLPADVQALYGEYQFLTSIRLENLTPPQLARRRELQTWYSALYKPTEESILIAHEFDFGADAIARAERTLVDASQAFTRK